MAAIIGSNHELLQVISGRSALRSEEQILDVLKANQIKLLNGLKFYKQPRTASATKLKNDKTIGKTLQEFVLKLSKFLGLDEWQSHELLQSFLKTAFKGTSKQLQAIITDDRNSQALIIKVSEYYFTERIALLHCIKHILCFWQDEKHPYKHQYCESMEDVLPDDKLITSILEQYDDRFTSIAPTTETNGQLMNERQSFSWGLQGLREQCELMECLLLYYRYFELQPNKLMEILRLFQRQDFGTRQPNRHLFDGDRTTEELMNRLGFLCSMVIVEGMDLYWIHNRPNSVPENVLVKNMAKFMEIDKLMLSLNNLNHHHGPILLSWAVLRSLALSDDSSHAVRKLGQQALQLQVFEYLALMLDVPPFTTDSTVAVTYYTLVYSLLSLVMSEFHEDTLGDLKFVLLSACKILKKEHICEDFWKFGQDSGMAMLLTFMTEQFPLQFSPLVKLLTSLSVTEPSRVFSYLDKLTTYLELFDNNRVADVDSTQITGQWQLLRNKIIYRPNESSGGVIMPAGTLGTMRDEGPGLPLVCWDWGFSGWQLFVCKIDDLLRITTHSIDHVPPSEVHEVKEIVDLVTQMLESDWSLSTRLQPIIARLYSIVQRCTSVNTEIAELLASCVKCLSIVAKHQPEKVWREIQQTGFLPYTGRLFTDVTIAASGAGIFPGNYGNILGNHERPGKVYSVTKAFLELLVSLIKGLSEREINTATTQDILACVIFVQWEIFASFYKWRYLNVTDREEIGRKSLEIFHSVLQVLPDTEYVVDTNEENVVKKMKGIPVRDAVVHGLLHTSAGTALLHILATGVDAIEQRFHESGSFYNSTAQDLTQMIKLAFSVVNRLLILKSNQDMMSPLEEELTEQTKTILQQVPLMATITSYIYHRHDPRLPILSTMLLKRLAMVAPMSIYGCLGIQAEAVRDAYQTRLQAFTEATRLKVVILEFLTAAVETQPGLIELFLDLEAKEKDQQTGKPQQQTIVRTRTDRDTEFQFGKASVLQTVLDMIEVNKQGTTHCPPDLHAAALGFLYALWQDRRDRALAVLRKRPRFWENAIAPLYNDLPTPIEDTQVISAKVKTVAYAMKIIASECYYVRSGALDKDLQDQMKRLQQQNRYTYWSAFIKELVEATESEGETLEDYLIFDHETLVALSAWKMLTVVAASNAGGVMCLQDDNTRNIILSHLLSAMKTQVADAMSIFNMKSASLLSNLYLTLLRHWTGCHQHQWSKLTDLVWILEKTKFGRLDSLSRIQTALLSAITMLLQYQKEKGPKAVDSLDNTLLARLLPLVCLAIQQCSVLYGQKKQSNPTQQPIERTEAMETDDTTQQSLKQQVTGENSKDRRSLYSRKYNLPIIGACLLDELIAVVDGPELWLPTVRQHSVIQLLLVTLKSCLVNKQGLYFAEAAMNLLLDMSTMQKPAEAVCNSGLTQYTCIAISYAYQKNSDGDINGHLKHKKVDKTDQVTWLGVYRQSLALYGSMLATLRHSFLTDAFNFFGVHQDRMTQCLNVVKNNHTTPCLLEAEKTTLFLFQLAHFPRQWRFEMPEELTAIQSTVCFLVQNCTALFIRPRLLQHRLLHAAGSHHIPPDVSRPTGTLRLQHQSSTEDVDTPTPELMAVQARLLNILGYSLAMLRHFNPELLEILLNLSMDVSDYVILFNLGFSTPSIDQDTPPSFGCLVACINMCVRVLYKLDGSKIGLSPLKSPEKSPARSAWEDSPIQRHMIFHILENALMVIMCQGMRYLKEPGVAQREKQLLKRELGAELSTFLVSLQRYFRRGGPGSPSSASPGSSIPLTASSSKTSLHGAFIDAQEQAFFRVVNLYVQQVLR
ncbi:nucleoporin NUP188-like [Glandiceps talaboti]